MAKEIEDKVYAALGLGRDLVAEIERDPDAEVPEVGARRVGRRCWSPPTACCPARSSAQRALDLAYRYLGRRDRTVVEMRRHLEGKRVEPELIDEAVAELLEQGYLDDARYAQRFAEDRRDPGRLGRRADRAAPHRGRGGPGGHRRRARARSPPRTSSKRPSRCCSASCANRPPTTGSARRRSGCSSARATSLEVAYDAVRAFERGALPDGQAPTAVSRGCRGARSRAYHRIALDRAPRRAPEIAANQPFPQTHQHASAFADTTDDHRTARGGARPHARGHCTEHLIVRTRPGARDAVRATVARTGPVRSPNGEERQWRS